MPKDNELLKIEIKKLIIEESGRDIEPADILDNEPLFGDKSRIMLDSLDVLQISVAVHKKYGKKLTDSKDAKRVFKDIETLAYYISSDI